MIKMKKTYIYRDNFGEEHKVKIFPNELRYVPYNKADTGIRALRVQNLCKLFVWEMYKDITLCSKSIVCKYDESLFYKSLTRDEFLKIAITQEELREIIDNFENTDMFICPDLIETSKTFMEKEKEDFELE